MKKSILLVDDHKLFLNSLVTLLENHYPSYSFTQVYHPEDAVEILKTQKFDLAILDINMPEMSGFELLEIIKSRYHSTLTLMLTMDYSKESIIKAFKIGCNGYLNKDIDKEELFVGINSIFKNGSYLNPFIQNILIHNLQNPNQYPDLTHIEVNLIKLFCSELTYKEIADKANMSSKTVEKYRQNIFQKLNVNNRVGVVLFAIKNNIIEL